MERYEVEKIIAKYTPDVMPLFADRFERWPTILNANTISNALYGMEKTYRGIGCDTEAQECFQAAVEIQLRKQEG